MKLAYCEIYSRPFDRSLTPEHHGAILAHLYFAGDKLIKVETDSRHMFAEQAVCALLAKYLGKPVLDHGQSNGPIGNALDGNRLICPLSVIIPRSIVEQRRVHEAIPAEISTEPKPLQLESGKFYRNRLGEVVGPMRDIDEIIPKREYYKFRFIGLNKKRDADTAFTNNGSTDPTTTTPWDLVEEVVFETQPEVDATTTLPPTASDYLTNAASIMEERGKQYDQAGGERSMGKCVHAFNTITGHELSEAEGWLLLQLLKDVRQWQRKGFHRDSADDCIAYAALKAEAKQREERNHA